MPLGFTLGVPLLHNAPEHSAPAIMTFTDGMEVETTGALQNDFWPVSSHDGPPGFMHVSRVKFEAVQVPPPRNGRTHRRPHFHNQPDDRTETISQMALQTGVPLRILGERFNNY